MTIADIRSKAVELLALIDALEEPIGLGTTAYSVGPVLLERATTNLAFPSHMGSWSTTNANLTAEAGGVRITETTGNGFHECYKSVGIGSGPHCHSVEVKAGTATKGRIWFVYGGVGFFADFDLSAGTISAASNFGGSTPHKSFIIPLEDGWFRVAVSGTVTATAGYIDVALRNDLGAVQYTGTGKYLLARNAQSEAGIAPSSFVATTSTSAARPQSSIVGMIPAVQAITLAIHARTPVAWPSDYAVLMHYDNNSLAPYNDLEVFQDSTGLMVARVTYNLDTKSDINLGVIEPNTEFKLAITASAAGLKASFNGSAVQSIPVTWPTDLTFRRWGTQMQGIREWNGWLYKAEQWNAVATDSQLQALSVL